ncbi:MAG: 1,4-dihydroxy-2-naphthoate octaprenyltransferase [Lascolabacillus sp.]|nr:1,4-dihydroxy-2-naphthoate octaprenyltransferase [Lascolabacillus sp.]
MQDHTKSLGDFMATFKQWISAFRLRTLFLAVATVILGSGLSIYEDKFNISVFIFALLLAVSIQILANLANDLGDYLKGTDTTGKREGPTRALQGGAISVREMKYAVIIFIVICLFSGIVLVSLAYPYINGTNALILLVTGLLCILAALFYTMGKNAYGYKGWGDLFAFFFFGPVPVIGTYFLHTHDFTHIPVLPAVGIGIISTMILNINNMRDMDNDRSSGKHTVAVKLGLPKSKMYHTILTMASFFCFLSFNNIYEPSPWYRYIYLIFFLTLFKILIGIQRKKGSELDPFLKPTALSGFIIAVVFSICINL